MTLSDAVACRRALREIQEIVAVSILDGGQMTEQEALEMIAPIAGWAAEDSRGAPRECSDLIRRLHALIGGNEVDTIDDHAALALFGQVIALLQQGSDGGDRPADP